MDQLFSDLRRDVLTDDPHRSIAILNVRSESSTWRLRWDQCVVFRRSKVSNDPNGAKRLNGLNDLNIKSLRSSVILLRRAANSGDTGGR